MDGATGQAGEADERRSGEQSLRLGIVLHSLEVERWVLPILAWIESSDAVAVPVVALAGEPRAGSRGSLLYRFYRDFDRTRMGAKPDPFVRVEAPVFLREARSIALPPGPSLGDAEAALADAGLDLILDLTRGTPYTGLEVLSRLGVWRHPRHALSRESDASELREIRDEQRATETVLVAECGDPDQPGALARSFTSTRMGSAHRNASIAAARFALLVVRCLERVSNGKTIPRSWGEGWAASESVASAPPSNLAMLGYLFRLASRLASRIIDARRSEDTVRSWVVGWRRAPPPDPGDFSPAGFHVLDTPPSRFFADPFPVEVDGRSYLFFEDYAYRRDDRAQIAWVEIGPDGTPTEPRPALACPYHLSYPFLFRHTGQLFMLPETAGNRTIEVWRPTSFPDRWEREKVLMDDVAAFDSTLLESDGRWWLFCTIAPADGGGPNDELHLFHAEDPFGEWTPHPMNPLVSDVRRARPAGNLFRRDGHWVRPAQDCAEVYGHAVCLNRIDVLSVDDYRETPLETLEASAWQAATRIHTLSHMDGLQAVDLSVLRPRGRGWEGPLVPRLS